MSPTVAVSTLLHLLSSFILFPVPISGVNRFDMEHVVSFRHGHNAGAPAQMRIMKPSITNARYKKSSADVEGSKPHHSMIQKAPANTPDEEHKLTKRDVASVQYNEQNQDPPSIKKVGDDTDKRAVAKDNVDQPLPGKGALSPDLGSVSNQKNLKNVLSVKYVTAKETLAHHQGKVLVFKASGSSEQDDDDEAAPEFPVPGFIDAPLK